MIIPGKPVTPSSLDGVTQRINTFDFPADSANFTTETALHTFTEDLVNGWTYGITVCCRPRAAAVGSPSAEVSLIRVREDNVSGTEIGAGQIYLYSASSVGYTLMFYTEYTAVATASKTFALTGARNNGANTHYLRASTSQPTFVTLDVVAT